MGTQSAPRSKAYLRAPPTADVLLLSIFALFIDQRFLYHRHPSQLFLTSANPSVVVVDHAASISQCGIGLGAIPAGAWELDWGSGVAELPRKPFDDREDSNPTLSPLYTTGPHAGHEPGRTRLPKTNSRLLRLAFVCRTLLSLIA
ncbi:unnamed protein product [Cyclocybe aegerita]|uniref:Uncharacterized protein n=1 Tax=Cyclocybe aegerita TaxID=1973307 RepID=A0A8S0W053_CYCAE|nr:unnamed protein product [Cyclocybe aegerita]